jgi:histidine triad (HIT) family protein
MSEDFYCDEALSGRTPIEVVAETDEVLAFRHTRPFWPVHIVVIPKRHVPSLVDLGAADEILLHKVLAVVRRIADEVTREYGSVPGPDQPWPVSGFEAPTLPREQR